MSDNHSGDYPDWLKKMLAQGMYDNAAVHSTTAAMTPEQSFLYMQTLSEQAKTLQKQVAHYQMMMEQQAEIAKLQAHMAQATVHEKKSSDPFDNEPMMQKAQAMLDNAMGEEEAGLFKELLGSLGMSDKDFWKGAMVGAAAALILSNDNVRKNIVGMLSGTGDLLKTGGETVKDAAVNTASSVKEGVATGSEVFHDTYQAGKEGFKESVERHKAKTNAVESVNMVENNTGSVDE